MLHSAESWLSAMQHSAKSWLRAMLHSAESWLRAMQLCSWVNSWFMNLSYYIILLVHFRDIHLWIIFCLTVWQSNPDFKGDSALCNFDSALCNIAPSHDSALYKMACIVSLYLYYLYCVIVSAKIFSFKLWPFNFDDAWQFALWTMYPCSLRP
jgi:hypothetical protein